MDSLCRFVLVSLLVAVAACAGSGKPAQTHATQEGSADPATKVTLKSASDPNRNSSSLDLGHDGAEPLNKPIDDCELPQCTGDAPPALVDAIRSRSAQARSCYEQALRSTPKIAGRLVLLMRVTHEGKSCPVHVSINELGDSQTLLPCVQAVLTKGTYPKATEGCVDLQLPLRFVPQFVDADAGTTSND